MQVLFETPLAHDLWWIRAANARLHEALEGYERAFGTILDSNVTSLIAGIALLIFGSGPVRGLPAW